MTELAYRLRLERRRADYRAQMETERRARQRHSYTLADVSRARRAAEAKARQEAERVDRQRKASTLGLALFQDEVAHA